MTTEMKMQILLNQVTFDFISKCVENGATYEQAKNELMKEEIQKEIAKRCLAIINNC